MNLKSKATGLTLFLAIVIGLSLTMIDATPNDTGPYVDEQWWQTIKSPDAQVIALLTHVVDAGPVPRPTDIPALKAAGLTINSGIRLGYDVLALNNIVYPTDDVEMRRAIIRLVDKDALDALLSPMQRHVEHWLPESQPAWVNPDAKLPLYDPATANTILNAAGYTYSSTPSPAGWYDPDVPGSQPYLRTDPDTGLPMEEFEYVTRFIHESPLYYEHSLIIAEKLHAIGIPAVLTPKSWFEIVSLLFNDDYEDYQLLTGLGLLWARNTPDPLYDLLESSQVPLWNLWNFANDDCDAACAAMKATQDVDELQEAAYAIQAIANEYIPYVPMMQFLTFTAQTGQHAANPTGAIKIVNALGMGAEASDNEFGKEFGESGRVEGGKTLYRHYVSEELTTLNPLMANIDAEWQVLNCIFGDFFRLNPYTHDYQWRAIEGMPAMAPFTNPEVEAGMTLEYTLQDNVRWHDGTPVTPEDCVFALDLMRFQENVKYRSYWEPIYDVVKTGDYSFKIWLDQSYVFAHEWYGISLLAPKHIWYDWVDSPETGEPLVISEGTGPMGGDEWIQTGRHHSEWEGWKYPHPTDPSATCLIGTDNFIYPPGGWNEYTGTVYVKAWKDETDNYMDRINPGDCNLDGLVDMDDVWQVLYRQGDFRGMCYPTSIGGHPRWDPIADIAGDAQVIDGNEIFVVQSNFGQTWGP